MPAYMGHQFKRGFLLDGMKLRTLDRRITERLGAVEPPIRHKFNIFRADSYSYETTQLEDAVKEDQADWQRITRLEIEASGQNHLHFELKFAGDGTWLNLTGDDKDQVYLLFSDVREYLDNEVNTCTWTPGNIMTTGAPALHLDYVEP